DKHVWTRSASSSTKLAYETSLLGGVKFELHKRLWKSWAPLKCKIFLWLAILNRCWTADRLERHGLQHADYGRDGAQHKVGLQRLASRQDDTVFNEWWRQAAKRFGHEQRKEFNTYVILIAWQLWKHHNRCVFAGIQPQADAALHEINDESRMWTMAGANQLRALLNLIGWDGVCTGCIN
ncbi:hypothetical protein EJB05_37684, partial [Eragrostis curvula]